jgi:hypothetical protein
VAPGPLLGHQAHGPVNLTEERIEAAAPAESYQAEFPEWGFQANAGVPSVDTDKTSVRGL